MTTPQQQAQFAVRFFLKPDGRHVVDFPLQPGQNMNDVVLMLRNDDAFWSPANLVRWESILFATLMPLSMMNQAPKPVLVTGPWPQSPTPPAS